MAICSDFDQVVRNLNVAYFARNFDSTYSTVGNSDCDYFPILDWGCLSTQGCKYWKKDCIIAVVMVFQEIFLLQPPSQS